MSQKMILIILGLLIIITKSIDIPKNDDITSNEKNLNENKVKNKYPPIKLYGNNENTKTEQEEELSKKEKSNIDEEKMKTKLSSLIDKSNKNKDYKNSFISYILSHEDKKKQYNDDIENGNNDDKLQTRYELYMESDKYIQELNKNLPVPIYNHTVFSDYSMEEKKALLIDLSELKRRLALQSCYQFAGWGSGSSKSVSYASYAQAVQHQGSSCGSCWAFASAAQYELNYYLYKNIKQKQSEQYILDCVDASIGDCDGGWPSDTNRWLGTYGSCPSYRSYDGVDTHSCGSCYTSKTSTSYTSCINEASTGYSGTSLSFWNVVANAAQYVGLTYWMGVSNNFYYISSSWPYLYECDSSNIIGYHAMAIYGEYYGDWLYIKNSWGTSWGDKGWFWLYKDARTSCNFQADVSFNHW